MLAVSNSWTQIAWAQLWQVTLLVVVVALLSRVLAKNRPHLAYAMWLVVLVKCLMPPLWSSPAGIFCWISPAPATEAPAAVDARSSPATPDAANGDPRLVSPSGDDLGQPMQPFPSEVVVVARPGRKDRRRYRGSR